jgi:hypothetical protein
VADGPTLAAKAEATTAEVQTRLGNTTSDAAMIHQHAAKGRDPTTVDEAVEARIWLRFNLTLMPMTEPSVPAFNNAKLLPIRVHHAGHRFDPE